MSEIEPKEAEAKAKYQIKREELDKLKVQTEEKQIELNDTKTQLDKIH